MLVKAVCIDKAVIASNFDEPATCPAKMLLRRFKQSTAKTASTKFFFHYQDSDAADRLITMNRNHLMKPAKTKYLFSIHGNQLRHHILKQIAYAALDTSHVHLVSQQGH